MLIDCWFVRAETLEDVVGGHIVFTMEGIWGRSDVRPGAQYWFQVDPLAQPGTVTLYERYRT